MFHMKHEPANRHLIFVKGLLKPGGQGKKTA